MTDQQIIAHLLTGEPANYGLSTRNMEVVDLMQALGERGWLEAKDVSTRQETRREVHWIGPAMTVDEVMQSLKAEG